MRPCTRSLEQEGCQSGINNPLGELPQLPEKIVCSILLLLPLKAAVRTSILCKKWQFLWKTVHNIIPNLDLEYENFIGSIDLDDNQKRKNFMEWGNKMIFKDNTRVKIISSKIAYPLKNNSRLREDIESGHFETIKKWVKNLASRRVEKLDIDLTGRDRNFLPHSPYHLVFSLFFPNESLKHLSLTGCRILPLMPNSYIRFVNLVSLTLGNVLLYNFLISWILSSCPNLECFTITHCRMPCSVIIAHSKKEYLKLKHFQMISCDQQPPEKELTIEIHNAMDLESVEIFGSIYKTSLKNSAQPYKLRFGFDNTSPFLAEEGLHHALCELPVTFPQIENLALSLANIKENTIPKQLKTFSKLKELDLDLHKGASSKGMSEITSYILKACPLLHRLIIHLPDDFLTIEDNEGLVEDNVGVNLVKDDFSFCHERLSDVEIDNFTGVEIQVNYVIRLLGDVIDLQKMRIRRRCKTRQGNEEWKKEMCVKQVYNLFVGKVPESTQLVVL